MVLLNNNLQEISTKNVKIMPICHFIGTFARSKMNQDTKIINENIQGQALMRETKNPEGKKLFLESYGCQMNFADSEIVASILIDKGFTTTQNYKEADVIFVNTCAIRDNAENRVRQ